MNILAKGESTTCPKWPACLGRSLQRESEGLRRRWASKIIAKRIAWRKKKKAQAAHGATDCFSYGLRADFLLPKLQK